MVVKRILIEIKFIDTYQEVISLLKRMNGTFDFDLWEMYIEGIYTGLLEKLKEDSICYDFVTDILPVMNLAVQNMDKVDIAHKSLVKAISRLSERFNSICDGDFQVVVIFYLGLCNGAGWATEIGNKSVVLLGIEKIVELSWYEYESIAPLVYHELGHIWHNSVNDIYIKSKSPIVQLYREGLAMYLEQLLMGDFEYYRQDRNGWLEWCKKNEPQINTELLRRFDADESVGEFFGDWNEYQGYSDVGYFIGNQFIKYLLARYSLDRVAKLDITLVNKEFRDYVEQTQ